MEDLSKLFIGKGGARATDPSTSHAAAKDTKARRTQRVRLFEAYYRHGGLTDERAGLIADVPNAHKRCSELLRDELLTVSGEQQEPGKAACRVCALTDKGRTYAAALFGGDA
jgi:hypothetical protein